MKSETMFCEFCGKKFNTEYWDGGYIDHYNNFALSNNVKYKKEFDEEYLCDEILTKGNDYRNLSDIKERLECFMHWDIYSDEQKKSCFY